MTKGVCRVIFKDMACVTRLNKGFEVILRGHFKTISYMKCM